MTVELHSHAVRLILFSLILLIPTCYFEFRKPSNLFFQGYWRMLGMWSLVDIVIGISSLIGKGSQDQAGLIRFLKFNNFLDVGYAVVGALMLWRASKPTVKGFGLAIITQGFLLLGLDIILLVRLTP